MSGGSQAEELFRAASSLFSAGDFMKSEALCRSVLAASPTHAGALDLIGLAQMKLGNHRHAVEYFERALAADPAFRAAQDHLERVRPFAARAAFAAGDLAKAESLSRAVLASSPNHAGALDLIGLVQMKLGNHRHAVDYFERALAADPAFKDAQSHLESVKPYATRALNQAGEQPQAPRFLVIKAWGYGFWSEINHVCGSLLLAEITGRTPLTFWGDNSLFGDGRAKDAFQLYFEPVAKAVLSELPLATPRTVYPPKWAAVGLEKSEHMKMEGPDSRLTGAHFLERSEAIVVTDYFVSLPTLIPWLAESHPMQGQPPAEVYRYVLAKYLKPRPHIAAAAEALYAGRVGGAPSVAVHMRGSDKQLEASTTGLLPLYFEYLDGLDPALRIFLLTDDTRCVTPFVERYGSRVVTSDVLRTSTDLGVHYMAHGDRVRLGNEIAIDTYAALHCDKFVGNGMSNPSAFISVLKQWPANDCVLLGGSILNLSLS